MFNIINNTDYKGEKQNINRTKKAGMVVSADKMSWHHGYALKKYNFRNTY